MLTIDQSNYLHATMREMEDRVQQVIGLDVHFGVYMRSKKISRLMNENEAVEAMAKALGVSMEDLKSPSKKGKLIVARKVITSLLRATFKISLEDVAKLLGRTDHSTAINLLSGATDLINSEDAEFLTYYNMAKSALEIT